MKNEFNTLLQKEMDRKSFLKHVGVGFAVITGAATLLKTLNSFGGSAAGTAFGGSQAAANDATAGYGYGATTYGDPKPVAMQQTAKLTYS